MSVSKQISSPSIIQRRTPWPPQIHERPTTLFIRSILHTFDARDPINLRPLCRHISSSHYSTRPRPPQLVDSTPTTVCGVHVDFTRHPRPAILVQCPPPRHSSTPTRSFLFSSTSCGVPILLLGRSAIIFDLIITTFDDLGTSIDIQSAHDTLDHDFSISSATDSGYISSCARWLG